MKVEVDLNDEFIDVLIAASLKDRYDSFKSDKHSEIFSTDRAEEKAERKRYREAFALVHNWYTPHQLHIKTKA